MKSLSIPRRRLILATCLAAAGPGWAEGRPVRLIVPAPAGGTLDATARLFAHRLTLLTGEPHVVENRPGANSLIAAELVARSPADGRTLMFAPGGLTFMPWLQKVSFKPLEELVPVVLLTQDHFVLVSTTNGRVTGLKDLDEIARRGSQALSCVASPGPPGIACEQLKVRLGGNAIAAPYPGVAPALAALLGGHADVMFVNAEAVAKLVASGRVRVLARSEHSPAGGWYEAPRLSDIWPGLLLDSHMGIMAPVGTPAARIAQINADCNRVLADPEVQAVLTRDGAQQGVGGTPERYAQEQRQTQDRYAEIIVKLGLGPK